MEQSIVSVRVGLSYDPLRLSSRSLDLSIRTFLLSLAGSPLLGRIGGQQGEEGVVTSDYLVTCRLVTGGETRERGVFITI